MNGIDLIYWLIGLSALVVTVAGIRHHGANSLWIWKGLLMLGLCYVSATTMTLKGVTVGVWILLFLLPITGFRMLQMKMAQGDYQASQQWATLLQYLHPGDGWQELPDLLQALTFAQAGRGDVAQSILARYQQANTPMAQNAWIILFRMERRWQDCLEWIESLPSAAPWLQSAVIMAAYCRCLGETQQYARLFELLDYHWPKIQQNPRAYNQLILLSLAFSGQWQGLHRFLQAPHNRQLTDAQDYWLATAAMTGGNFDFAQMQFQKLLDNAKDPSLKKAAAERLRSPLKPARQYLPLSLERNLKHFTQRHPTALSRYDFGQRPAGQYWVTWILIIANVGMFGLESIQGSTEDPDVLYALGGLWPPDVWAGEYWRLITANFLHSGMLHIGLNMAGLLILGPFIERVLGWFKFSIIYAVSGLGAAACIALMPLWFDTEPEFTVGASGAIMGLVGAIAAVTLWGWVIDKASIAARRFQSISIMIVVQVIFDLSMPQISVTGHLSGMVIGFFVTLFIIAVFGFKEPVRRPIGTVN